MGSPDGRTTVLLVEDECAVRLLARLTLEQEGCVVLEAADGAAAVRFSETHPGPIHLLLTDLVLPDMSGGEVSQAVRSRRPTTKVLFTSGYQKGWTDLVPEAAFLPKPYTPTTLATKVREVLAG